MSQQWLILFFHIAACNQKNDYGRFLCISIFYICWLPTPPFVDYENIINKETASVYAPFADYVGYVD
jgi:hypothetical protein